MSRKSQIAALQRKASELAQEVDELVDELEEALENMPESIQFGDRGQVAQERIDALAEWRDNLNDMAGADDV